MPTFQQISRPTTPPGADIFTHSETLSFPAPLLPTAPVEPPPANPGTISLHLKANPKHQLHPQLGPTTAVWGYNGTWPGPTIEVQSGSRLRVKFFNDIKGTMPFAHVEAIHPPDQPEDNSTTPQTPALHFRNPMNDAGRIPLAGPGPVVADPNVTALHAHTVPHLHGAPTEPDSDGWTDNVASTGTVREFSYEFPREEYHVDIPTGMGTPTRRKFHGGAAPLFWYHDHAMGVTRYNVYAGLSGGCLVRDKLEAKLGLPGSSAASRHAELPLILQDRNFETRDDTATGELTGRLLHKVQDDVMEAFSPGNVVNGKLWPNVNVHTHVYRLRLVNGANARVYRLHFLVKNSSGAWESAPSKYVQQIGTDGGLLGHAIHLPALQVSADGIEQATADPAFPCLILAPGERADVLVDFGGLFKDGFKEVTVFNSTPAPFGGGPIIAASQAQIIADITGGSEPDLREIPEVMRFHIKPAPGARPAGPHDPPIAGAVLDSEFKRLKHPPAPGSPAAPDRDDEVTISSHGHSFIVLREEAMMVLDEHNQPIPTGDPNKPGEIKTRPMLALHEMMEEEAATNAGMNMYETRQRGAALRTAADGSVYWAAWQPGDPESPASPPSRAGIRVEIYEAAGISKKYVTAAHRFTDTTTIFIEKDAWHVWKILNLSPDTHPFHIHLVQFQALCRRIYMPFDPTYTGGAWAGVPSEQSEFKLGSPAGSTPQPANDQPPAQPVDQNEEGWKDTVRVNPGDRDADSGGIKTAEMLVLGAQFRRHAGRYMYHCHILEHEDQEMMRPFNVVEPELTPFMNHMGPNHNHGSHIATANHQSGGHAHGA